MTAPEVVECRVGGNDMYSRDDLHNSAARGSARVAHVVGHTLPPPTSSCASSHALKFALRCLYAPLMLLILLLYCPLNASHASLALQRA